MVAGGVPVLHLDAGDDAGPVVNFLRCGCPAVQLTSDRRAFTEYAEKLNQRLAMLAIDTEEFVIREHVSDVATDLPEDYHVLIVTRVVRS
jgi:hypothetical protein